MPTLLCCVLIVAVGTPNSSFAANREGVRNTESRARIKQKNSRKARRPTPFAIWKGIKAVAQNEVRSDSSLIIYPRFTVKQIGSTPQLTIETGDVSGLGFGDDPYEIPFKKQMLIEALRRSLAATNLTEEKKPATKDPSRRLSGSSQAARVGRPHLLRAENLVKKTVVDIESERDKGRLGEKLRESEQQIDDILYDKIYVAIEQVAQRKGYNIIRGRGGPRPIPMFLVEIITDPDKGKVFVMTDLSYRKQLITKTDRSRWPWIEIVQNPYRLAGKYRYRTIWPDGKRAEGTIHVANPGPVKFRPNY